MNFRVQCSCGKRSLERIEKPTNDQVAEEMYHGFLAVECKGHKEASN